MDANDRRRRGSLCGVQVGDGASVSLIQGQLLRLSARREVAIYLRGEMLWVADFIDGHGELFEPEVWFRFNCGSPDASAAQRRMLLESGLPLTGDIATKIEELHRVAAESNPDHPGEDAS
jgi:hypothetical protein